MDEADAWNSSVVTPEREFVLGRPFEPRAREKAGSGVEVGHNVGDRRGCASRG